MSTEYRVDRLDPEVRRCLDGLQTRVLRGIPDADFLVYEGDDPAGIYLAIISDVPDGFDVLDLVSDRIVDLLLEENVAVHVVPVHRAPPADDPPGGETHRRYRALSLDQAAL